MPIDDDHQKQKLKDMYGHDFDILQETTDFLVINKPSWGFLSHILWWIHYIVQPSKIKEWQFLLWNYHKHRTKEGKVHKASNNMKSTKDFSSEENDLLERIPKLKILEM